MVIFHMCNTVRFICQFRLHFELLGPADFLPGGLVAKSCPTLCDPMDYSLAGSSVHEIIPGKNTGVVAISSSRGSSLPGDPTQVSCIAGFFTDGATRGALIFCLLVPSTKREVLKLFIILIMAFIYHFSFTNFSSCIMKLFVRYITFGLMYLYRESNCFLINECPSLSLKVFFALKFTFCEMSIATSVY